MPTKPTVKNNLYSMLQLLRKAIDHITECSKSLSEVLEKGRGSNEFDHLSAGSNKLLDQMAKIETLLRQFKEVVAPKASLEAVIRDLAEFDESKKEKEETKNESD